MVRMRSGIAEEEDQASALAKLREELARRFPEPDLRTWVEPPLAPPRGRRGGAPPPVPRARPSDLGGAATRAPPGPGDRTAAGRRGAVRRVAGVLRAHGRGTSRRPRLRGPAVGRLGAPVLHR